ncbi:hypothetical protein GBA52_015116 [Prunus armeniaca]|nr:hypothetical protein GBA52_015116 [Prunus armeniaca]
MAKTQQVTQPSGSREVDRGVIDNPSHIPDHQVVSLGLETTLVDPMIVREEIQILPDHSSDPRDPTDHSTNGQTLQPLKNLHFLTLVYVVDHHIILANHTANASGVLQAILVTLSDEHASQIPQPSSDVSIPILRDQQPEVEDSNLDYLLFISRTIWYGEVEDFNLGSLRWRSQNQEKQKAFPTKVFILEKSRKCYQSGFADVFDVDYFIKVVKELPSEIASKEPFHVNTANKKANLITLKVFFCPC